MNNIAETTSLITYLEISLDVIMVLAFLHHFPAMAMLTVLTNQTKQKKLVRKDRKLNGTSYFFKN